MKTHDIDIQLRGQSVTLEFQASVPDPSVGLFGWRIEEYRVLDEDGAALEWELQEDEMQAIQPQVDGYMHAWTSCDD